MLRRCLNILEEVGDTTADDVAGIDEQGAGDVTEIDHDDGDDEAWEDAFDAVVVDAKSGELGIDDDEDEDNEDDVGEVSHVGPDLENWGGGVGDERLHDEKLFDKTINSVDEAATGVQDRTNDPRNRAGFLLADGLLFIFVLFFVLVCLILFFVGLVGFGLGGSVR